MFIILKELIIFFTRYDTFKYLETLFNFYNMLAFLQCLINNILFNFLYCFHIGQILEYLQDNKI